MPITETRFKKRKLEEDRSSLSPSRHDTPESQHRSSLTLDAAKGQGQQSSPSTANPLNTARSSATTHDQDGFAQPFPPGSGLGSYGLSGSGGGGSLVTSPMDMAEGSGSGSKEKSGGAGGGDTQVLIPKAGMAGRHLPMGGRVEGESRCESRSICDQADQML